MILFYFFRFLSNLRCTHKGDFHELYETMKKPRTIKAVANKTFSPVCLFIGDFPWAHRQRWPFRAQGSCGVAQYLCLCCLVAPEFYHAASDAQSPVTTQAHQAEIITQNKNNDGTPAVGSQEVDSDVSEHQPQPIRQVRHRRCRTGYGQRPGKSEPSIWLRERAGQGEPVRMTIQHLILADHLCIWWETRQQSIRIRSKTERGSSPSWTGWPAAERELMSGPCHALQAAHCLANCRCSGGKSHFIAAGSQPVDQAVRSSVRSLLWCPNVWREPLRLSQTPVVFTKVSSPFCLSSLGVSYTFLFTYKSILKQYNTFTVHTTHVACPSHVVVTFFFFFFAEVCLAKPGRRQKYRQLPLRPRGDLGVT